MQHTQMAQIRLDNRQQARDGWTFNVLLENNKEANVGAETSGYEPIYHYHDFLIGPRCGLY